MQAVAGVEGGSWDQTEDEVRVEIPVASTVDRKAVSVNFGAKKVCVKVLSAVVLETDLFAEVERDECYWALTTAKDGARLLTVTFAKKKQKSWNRLTLAADVQGDGAPVDPAAADLARALEEYELGDEEDAVMQSKHEELLTEEFEKQRAEKGLEHDDTLKAFFTLFSEAIQLYKLNKMSKYLDEVLPVCRKRNDEYTLKAVQSTAFVKYKQSKFSEAVPLFLEMEAKMGKNACLCENIGLTYSALGQLDEAEKYLMDAIRLMDVENLTKNKAGSLLGLGLVRDRQGRPQDGLPLIKQAYELYMAKAEGRPNSLQAKAGVSYAKIEAKFGNHGRAEELLKQAVEYYEITCGETSPLTATGYHELGLVQWAQRKREAARKSLFRAYQIESSKDAFDITAVFNIHNALMDTHLLEVASIEREAFAAYFDHATSVEARVRAQLQDGNAAVFYKSLGELRMWGGDYTGAKRLLGDALAMLKVETTLDCTKLCDDTTKLLQFCDRCLAGTQASPMSLETNHGTAAASGAGGTDETKADDAT